MSQPTPQILQTYTLLQIAAEAFLGRNREAPAARPGEVTEFQFDVTALMEGNGHSTRMTQKQAEQFAREWKVISHQPNTATGFSGTLFQCLVNDPRRGMVMGQLVVSLRSTEFLEDTARDNQATNTLELSQGGWAFGQMADMDTWFQAARFQNDAAFRAAGGRVDVTGYSLGGALAASFYELYGTSVVDEVYTFNGAGVGTLKSNTSLRQVVDQFKGQRAQGANADWFTNADARPTYGLLADRYQSDAAKNTSATRPAANAGSYCHAA